MTSEVYFSTALAEVQSSPFIPAQRHQFSERSKGRCYGYTYLPGRLALVGVFRIVMPIVKIKREHKFGIVSLARAKQLLSKVPVKSGKRRPRPSLIPEINQEFISKYNSRSKEDRAPLDAIIKGALQHAKYKTGLIQASHPKPSSSNSSTNSSASLSHQPSRATISAAATFSDSCGPDVSYAWLELTLLSQCDSPMQQEILMTLCKSLSHSPVSVTHISSLFHIAGLCYQWLKRESLAQSLLRTGELLLLKILYLVSLRLFYHHLYGYLVDCCTKEEIRQLRCDLEGFENKELSYRTIPESLFYWKFSLEVGLLVCEYYHGSKSLEDIQRLSKLPSSENPKEKEAKAVQIPSPDTSRTSCVDSGTCSVLWHSLDIWQCVKHGSDMLQEAIQDFLSCSIDFKEDNWMEGFLAMSILCTTSELSLQVLNFVQSLAAGLNRRASLTENSSKSKSQGSQSQSQTDKDKMKLRFTIPNSMDLGCSTKAPLKASLQEMESSTRKMPTLNVLGMQPDFNIPDGESVYTRTEFSPLINTGNEEERNLIDFGLVSTEIASADYIRHRHMKERQPAFLRKTSYTPDTIRTQSLIENESIPDPLPSALNSNTTVMDMTGSITTVDLGESLGKSAGHLLMSSNSKNLDSSVSNLVSPCVLPSGELENIEDQAVQLTSLSSDAKDLKSSSISLSDQTRSKQDESFGDNPLTGSKERVKPLQVKVVSLPEEPDERNVFSRCTHYTHSTAPLAGGANMLGSLVHPSTVIRQSGLYSMTSVTTQEGQASTRSCFTLQSLVFNSWPNEVVLAYVLGMASCTIYGRTSLIQRTAMQGFVQESEVSTNRSSSKRTNPRMKSGLLSLVEFDEGRSNDESCLDWFVRYMAVMGLYRVTRTCQLLPMKDDFSSVAWTKLMERQRKEQDQRVLSAFIVAQGMPDMDSSLIELEDYNFSSPLITHIADELSNIFLPPLPMSSDTVPGVVPNRKKLSNVASSKKSFSKADYKNVQARIDTRMDSSHLVSRVDAITRRFGKLNEIAKEDWKRQMEEEEEEENQEYQT